MVDVKSQRNQINFIDDLLLMKNKRKKVIKE
jgi:hypothetical protein